MAGVTPSEPDWLRDHPIAAEFDVAANAPLAIDRLRAKSNVKVWWRCRTDPGHRWHATPNNRIGRGSGCPFCSGARVSDANRLSLVADAELLDQWDHERNELSPEDVSAGSNRKVWWICPKDDEHRWEATISHRVAGRGCPFCAGNRVSNTNRLSTLRPAIAADLNVELSGVTADDLSIGSNRLVWWNCPVNPRHEPWKATVLNRTGGFNGQGTECPSCQLVQTSKQELRLKAELAEVLPVDVDRKSVRGNSGRLEKVDIVAEDPARGLRLVVEFDGAFWHDSKTSRDRDTAKAHRLREAGWTVVRIREHPLQRLDPRYDIVVGFQDDAHMMAAQVLQHLATLGVITTAEATAYRADGGARAKEHANQWILEALGEEESGDNPRGHDQSWQRMHAALAEFEAQAGHCRPPEGISVEGVDLARWVHKQRGLHRRGTLPAERARQLLAISTWSFDSPHDAEFWQGYRRYAAWAGLPAQNAPESDKALTTREATVWASNLRTRRQRLQTQGQDLPADRLEALAAIPGWRWEPAEDDFQDKLAVLHDFVTQTGNTITSIKQRDSWQGHTVGVWINSWRTRRDRLSPERQRLLEALPGWAWDKHQDAWETMLAALAAFGEQQGHVKPSLSAPDEDERALARWKRNHKNRLQGQASDKATRLRTLLAEYGEAML